MLYTTGFSRLAFLIAAAVLLGEFVSTRTGASLGGLTQPALIAVNDNTKALEYWPIRPGGGTKPLPLSRPGLFSGFGMVANGNAVAFANQYPPRVVEFDVTTKREFTLPDPYGTPVDIAIGKDASLYIVNITKGSSNVTMYPRGATAPRELRCKYMYFGQQIAVDNEGDIFVNGYETDNSVGVVEIPNGPNGPEPDQCVRLRLKVEPGYSAGLAVDPKTDALIVLDNPDMCAGGVEGRMTIYPKPYLAKTGQSHRVGQNCSGALRLNADSTIVFVLDQDVAGANAFVLQRSYPDGRALGAYTGGQSTSITSIPNTLPN